MGRRLTVTDATKSSPLISKSGMKLRLSQKPGPRKCSRCFIKKQFPDEFAKRYGTNRHRGTCLDCIRASQLSSIDKKRDWYRKRMAESRQRRHRENMQRVVNYLIIHPCIDCGEEDWMVLQFDHVRGKKQFTISRSLSHRKWTVIKEEIKKCEIRCANCHMRKTIKENGFLTYINVPGEE